MLIITLLNEVLFSLAMSSTFCDKVSLMYRDLYTAVSFSFVFFRVKFILPPPNYILISYYILKYIRFFWYVLVKSYIIVNKVIWVKKTNGFETTIFGIDLFIKWIIDVFKKRGK